MPLDACANAAWCPDTNGTCDAVQVAEWKAKLEATEKREAERREAEARTQKEEVGFLEGQGKEA